MDVSFDQDEEDAADIVWHDSQFAAPVHPVRSANDAGSAAQLRRTRSAGAAGAVLRSPPLSAAQGAMKHASPGATAATPLITTTSQKRRMGYADADASPAPSSAEQRRWEALAGDDHGVKRPRMALSQPEVSAAVGGGVAEASPPAPSDLDRSLVLQLMREVHHAFYDRHRDVVDAARSQLALPDGATPTPAAVARMHSGAPLRAPSLSAASPLRAAVMDLRDSVHTAVKAAARGDATGSRSNQVLSVLRIMQQDVLRRHSPGEEVPLAVQGGRGAHSVASRTLQFGAVSPSLPVPQPAAASSPFTAELVAMEGDLTAEASAVLDFVEVMFDRQQQELRMSQMMQPTEANVAAPASLSGAAPALSLSLTGLHPPPPVVATLSSQPGNAVEALPAPPAAADMSFGDLELDFNDATVHAQLDAVEKASQAARAPAPAPTDAFALEESWAQDVDMLQALDAAEAAAAGSAAAPPVHVSWDSVHDGSRLQVAERLGALAEPSPLRVSQQHDGVLPAIHEAAAYAPVFLRAVVLAASCALPGAAAVISPAAAPYHQERLTLVAYVGVDAPDARPRGSRKERLHLGCVVLRGEWLQVNMRAGDIIHIVAQSSGHVRRWCDYAHGGIVAILTALRFDAHAGSVLTEQASQDVRACVASMPHWSSLPLPNAVVCVDDACNALVLHPDLLLPPTRIVRAFSCLRRATLSEVMGEAGAELSLNARPLLGQLKHSLFEAGMRLSGHVRCPDTLAHALRAHAAMLVGAKPPQAADGTSAADTTAQRMQDLCAAGVDDSTGLNELLHVVPSIVHWICSYVYPVTCTAVHDHTSGGGVEVATTADSSACIKAGHSGQLPPFLVTHVVSTEDELWSPVWGLRGVVDVTVDVLLLPRHVRDAHTRAQPAFAAASHSAVVSARCLSVRVPLELKTGRWPARGSFITDHRAQMTAYTIMMGERTARTRPVWTSVVLPGRPPGVTAASNFRGVASGAAIMRSASMPAYMPSQPFHASSSALKPAPGAPPALSPDARVIVDLGDFESSRDVNDDTLVQLASSVIGGLLVYLSPTEHAAADAPAREPGALPPIAHMTAAAPITWAEQRALIMARNRLASALVRARVSAGSEPSPQQPHAPAVQLPPLEQDEWLCSRCESLRLCMLMYGALELPCAVAAAAAGGIDRQAAFEDGSVVPTPDALASRVSPLYTDVLRTIRPAGMQYFRSWLQCVQLEAAGAGADAPAAPPASALPAIHAPAAIADIEDVGAASATLSSGMRRYAQQLSRTHVYGPRSCLWGEDVHTRERAGNCIPRLVLLQQRPLAQASNMLPLALTADADAVTNESKVLSQFSGSFFTNEDEYTRDTIRSAVAADAPAILPDDSSRDVVAAAVQAQAIAQAGGDDSGVPTYEYVFITLEEYMHAQTGTHAGHSRSLADIDIAVGRRVIISADGCTLGPFALVEGTITAKSRSRVVVRGDRDAMQAFPTYGAEGASTRQRLWRIDADEYGPSNRVITDNLVRFTMPAPEDAEPVPPAALQCDHRDANCPCNACACTGDDFQAVSSRLQGLLIDARAPRFSRQSRLPWDTRESELAPHDGASRSSSAVTSMEDVLKHEFEATLNDDQRAAVRSILTAEDYTLVLGMPGTGKTSTIALAVRCLVQLGRTVLIASHTHSAVDNLLLKLLDDGVDVLRIGRPEQVHPRLKATCLDAAVADGRLASVEALSRRIASAPVVGATCLGIRNVAFATRRFDVVIVDEAGQIAEPIAIGPLRLARAFVLVGDHHQLPPLVAAPAARERGLGVSLFQRLCDAHPSAVVPLRFQYRMNEDIQALPNALVYSHALRCGAAAVASARLRLPKLQRLPAMTAAVAGRLDWLQFLLQAAATVVFLNTDTVGDVDAAMASSSSAPAYHEARIAGNALQQLRTRKVTDNTVGAYLADAVVASSPGDRRPADADEMERLETIDLTAAAPAATQQPNAAAAGEASPVRVAAVRAAAAPATPPASSDASTGGSLVNRVEASIVATIAQGILRCGGMPDDVGIIAPYRSQLRLIRTLLDWLAKRARSRGTEGSGSASAGLVQVEVDTVDRFQGKDKAAIIMSFTRSNADGNVGMLINDRARLNVAITRAKAKLILVGSRTTLVRGSPLLSAMMDHLEAHQQVVDLPPLAHACYYQHPLDMAWRRLNGAATATNATAGDSSTLLSATNVAAAPTAAAVVSLVPASFAPMWEHVPPVPANTEAAVLAPLPINADVSMGGVDVDAAADVAVVSAVAGQLGIRAVTSGASDGAAPRTAVRKRLGARRVVSTQHP